MSFARHRRSLVVHAHGLSLIEVLVTLVILTLGLLGIAALQAATLRWSADSAQTAATSQLALDLAERMRANPSSESQYLAAGAGAPCANANDCSGQDRAASDILEWRKAVALRLPDGLGHICHDDSPHDGTPAMPACSGSPFAPLVVKFWWSARDINGSAVDARHSLPQAVVVIGP
ncbi:MAG: type IV pilus modification protein PilV [Burkholderiaceae bacterium]